MIPPATPDTDRAVLDDDAIDYLRTDGFDLLARWERHGAFWDARLATGLDPSSRTVADRGDGVARVLTRGHEAMTGIDLSSRDPLSLAHHPRLRAVAIEAASRWGVHAAGPLSSQGGSPPLIRLEERIAETLCYAEAVIFPTRWASGQGTIRALVRPSDHVVIDADSSSGLLDGAATATANVHRLPECSPEAAGAVLARIRARDARIGILVVAQTLSERDSTVADIAGLRDVCRSWNANLLVDISGDFGAMGDGGLGVLGAQGMIGEVDVVVGSLSPTFAANGGFAAAASPGIRQALVIFAAALAECTTLSPMNAAVALAAFDIVRSAEGARRRRRLMENVSHLRAGLAARAFAVSGRPGVIVPVMFSGTAEARSMTRAALRGGGLVNLMEHPNAPAGAPRWCLAPASEHSRAQMEDFVEIAVAARNGIGPETMRSKMPGQGG